MEYFVWEMDNMSIPPHANDSYLYSYCNLGMSISWKLSLDPLNLER